MENPNKKIEDALVGTYKAIESGVVGAYQKVENGVVGAYRKVEDGFIEKYLLRDGETLEQAKSRLKTQA